jgi:hypothetical protein
VKAQFKEDSPAWNSVIIKSTKTGRLDLLWKLFLDKYDNPVTKARAVRLVRSFYEKTNTKGILGLFTFHRTFQQARSGGQGDTTAAERREAIELAADAQETTTDASNSRWNATKHGSRNSCRYSLDTMGLDTPPII